MENERLEQVTPWGGILDLLLMMALVEPENQSVFHLLIWKIKNPPKKKKSEKAFLESDSSCEHSDVLVGVG